jgi:Protein of unknown function (DUF4054)
MITTTQFLARYPQFGGVDPATIQLILDHAQTQYDNRFANDQIYLALTAHILATDEIGMSESVARMDSANSGRRSVQSGRESRGQSRSASSIGNWRGDSLNQTPYGQEVLRMLLGSVVAVGYIP